MDNKEPHSLALTGRKNGKADGVCKVVGASADSIVLVTGLGPMTVSGKELKIVRYDEGTGKLEFEGEVNSIKYEGGKKPLLKRIFK